MIADVWPVPYFDEMSRRYRLVKKLNDHPELRPIAMAYYKNNPVEWINDFCMTFDPRNKPPVPRLIPFVLFLRQREFIQFLKECYEQKENGLTEKARDIGASWLCCAFSAWLWLFHDGATIGWGSRKEDYVDKRGDPKAIFPKIRQILENLPRWMMPERFNPITHSAHMKIINPSNGSSITGEAGDSMGRGGRTTMYFKDESAHYERPEMIEAALGDNTDVQIDISSVNGTANVFYRRRMAGEIWTPGCKIPPGKTRVFIFDWRDHPGKNQEWYDKRRERADREGLLHLFNQEVDRDYSGAVLGVIIPQPWVKAAIDAHKVLGFGLTGEKIAAIDPADEGGDKNALAIRDGVILVYVEDWGEGDTGQTTRRCVMECKLQGVNEIYYDCIGVGAGVKSESNRMRDEKLLAPRMRIMKWDASASPLEKDEHVIPGDPDSPTNDDIYDNLKAQSWWNLRIRFEKTYKALTQGKIYPHDELISLSSEMPKIHELTLQLSQPTRKISLSTGKMVVNKKPDGSMSPNLADAVNMAYNPTRELSIFDVL